MKIPEISTEIAPKQEIKKNIQSKLDEIQILLNHIKKIEKEIEILVKRYERL